MQAQSERGLQGKSDCSSHRQWEGGEFPILCEGCLGENPYIRMMTDRYGGVCKMCERPFTIFKWRPGRGDGYKKTEVCQTCSKTKNVCQTCILDLQFGLPSQLRDSVLASVDGAAAIPESSVSKEYAAQQQMALIAEGNNPWTSNDQETPNEKLLNLARNAKRNREQPRIHLPASFIMNSNAQAGVDVESLKQQEAYLAQLHPTVAHNPHMMAPPGVSNMQYASANFARLPAGFKVFAPVQEPLIVAPTENDNSTHVGGDGSSSKKAKSSSAAEDEVEEGKITYITSFSSGSAASATSGPASSSKSTADSTNDENIKSSSNNNITATTNTDSSRSNSASVKKSAKGTVKHAPRPPSGPPPPSAFAQKV